MPTCADIVKRALARLRVIDSIDNPSTEDAAAVMIALQDLFNRYVTAALGRLEEVYVTSDYTALENVRVRRSASQTITYPARITRENRDPYDGSLVVVTGSPRSSKVYDADTASWVVIEGLVLADECPFAHRDAAGIAAAVAQDCQDIFGKSLSQASLRDAARGRMMLSGVIGGPLRPLEGIYY